MSEIPEIVKQTVDFRDKQRCVRCAVFIANSGSRHHRQRRGVGGHLVANVVLLCGSGTTGCHGWAHSHPEEARACGLIVRTSVEDVSSVPLEIIDLDFGFNPFYVLLDEQGARARVDDDVARSLLEVVA